MMPDPEYANYWRLYAYCFNQPVDYYDPFGAQIVHSASSGYGINRVEVSIIFPSSAPRVVVKKRAVVGAIRRLYMNTEEAFGVKERISDIEFKADFCAQYVTLCSDYTWVQFIRGFVKTDVGGQLKERKVKKAGQTLDKVKWLFDDVNKDGQIGKVEWRRGIKGITIEIRKGKVTFVDDVPYCSVSTTDLPKAKILFCYHVETYREYKTMLIRKPTKFRPDMPLVCAAEFFWYIHVKFVYAPQKDILLEKIVRWGVKEAKAYDPVPWSGKLITINMVELGGQ